MKSIIEDQYTAAQAYFLCVIGMLTFESIIQLPSYLPEIRKKGFRAQQKPTKHLAIISYIHKLSTLPSLIPFITNHRLPNLIRLGIFIGLNILWGWNSNEFTTDYKLYGWLTISNGGLGFLLATRSSLFTYIARIPSSTLLMYHRWIGRATIIHATIHFSLNTHHDIMTDQLATAFSNRRIQIGIMAWLALCIIAITSISFIRRRFFEVFYYSHFLFLVFAVGALIHASKGPEFLLPGIGLWVVDRLIRFWNNFRKSSIKSVTHYSGDVTKFEIEGVKPIRPGQMAWIQVRNISFLNWHPFTIASAPGEDAVIAVRGLGGYSKKLQHLDPIKQLDPRPQLDNKQLLSTTGSEQIHLRIDGPYGLGRTRWGQHAVTVLVAGGIGITPGISIASHIINVSQRLEENGEEQSQGTMRHIHLLWIIKGRKHVQWFETELIRLVELAKSGLCRATIDITIHVTGTTASSEESIEMAETNEYSGPGTLVQGRPDMIAWFNMVKAKRPGSDAVINVCGPKPLVRAVRKAAAKVSSVEGLFYVEEETFEL